jgi:hypothetical protein
VPSRSHFSVLTQDDISFYGKSRIGESLEHPYGSGPWSFLLAEFGRWTQDVKVEIETPDIWEELREGNELFSVAPQQDLPNTPFTEIELAQIAQQLRKIKAYIKESRSLSEEKTALLEARFDEAEEASRRTGRKDWFFLFGGVLLSLILSAVVPPDLLLHIFAMTAHGLGHLFGGEAPRELPPET